LSDKHFRNRRGKQNGQICAYIGHERLDTLPQLAVLRLLHQKLRLYHNLFQPVMKLKSKEYVEPLQYRRKFDTAQTPFERLVQMKYLDEATQTKLENLRKSTNPLGLAR